MGFLFRTVIGSSSNKQDKEKHANLVELISPLLIEGDIEDFILIDILLASLMSSRSKMNPHAASVVKDSLRLCRGSDFEDSLVSWFHTILEE